MAAAFHADVQAELVKSLRFAATIGVVVVPSFYLLDRIAQPEHAGLFLTWRLAASATLALVVAGTYTRPGRRSVTALGYLALLSAALPVSAMVAYLDPGVSPYYAGLTLAMLFNGVLFPWRPAHTAAVNAVIAGSFLLPALLHGGAADLAAFTNNSFFVLVTAGISTISSWSLFRERRRRFELSWSLEARSADLSAANELLRQVDELKNRFFANVSHELRTPLTLALSPLAALAQDPALPAALRPTVKSLHLDMLALSRRIEDLIDLARLDSGRRDVGTAPVDLGAIISQVVAAARPFAERQGITLRIDLVTSVPTRGDSGILEQVVFNLLSNALKFTPRGGTVGLRLSVIGHELALTVDDTGQGIAPEDQEDLFLRFGRSTQTPSARGAGLGLALVKEFVELHGGTVAVRSRVGVGTSFDVRLPTSQGAAEPHRSAHARQLLLDFESELGVAGGAPTGVVPPDDGRALVMVVEDNARLRQFVSSSLADDFRVIEAADGLEALELLRSVSPVVIVCDMMMPRMDGRGLVSAVRGDPALRTLPVILLTAHGDAEVRDDALELGASDFLTKPFSVRELRARVRNFVVLRSAEVSLSNTNAALGTALAEVREAQVRAVRAEKLAAIGQLASGIGHEVKNPVNFLLNFARPSRSRLAKIGSSVEKLEGGRPILAEVASVAEALDRIVEGGERIVTIVNGLQAFARGGQARVPVSVDEEVAAVLRMTESSMPPGVTLVVELGAVGSVLGSPVSVGAVTLNLVSNAVQALDGPGRVWVETSVSGDDVVLVVRDEGRGISEGDRARIWDPFFTTRAAGEGLGLGLALVHRIIHDDMGGQVDVESELGKGTTFRVRMPRTGGDHVTAWSDLSQPAY